MSGLGPTGDDPSRKRFGTPPPGTVDPASRQKWRHYADAPAAADLNRSRGWRMVSLPPIRRTSQLSDSLPLTPLFRSRGLRPPRRRGRGKRRRGVSSVFRSFFAAPDQVRWRVILLPRRVPVEPPDKPQTEAAVVHLTPGKLNAVRAAFKPGVKPAQIAGTSGLPVRRAEGAGERWVGASGRRECA